MNINVNEYKLPIDKSEQYGIRIGPEELSDLQRNVVILAS